MAPLAEMEYINRRSDHVKLHLKDDGRPFDINYFDSLVFGLLPEKSKEISTKFIVVDDVMYIFRDTIQHSDFFNGQNFTKKSNVQCAGYLMIDNSFESPIRLVTANSSSLADERILDIEQSNEYKHGFLKQVLGSYAKFVSDGWSKF